MKIRFMVVLTVLVQVLAINSVLAEELRGGNLVSGTVIYLQRSLLPPDAVVQVRLEDVSLQDTAATIVSEIKFSADGRQVPIPFQMLFDRETIKASHTYNLRGSILAGERLLFTTTSASPVITRGGPLQAELLLQPVQRAQPTTAARLEGEYSYQADAGIFIRCGSKIRYPVSQEGDNAALERAYLESRTAPGSMAFIVVQGRIEPRPKMDGEGTVEKLVVSRFEQVRSGDSCKGDSAASSLQGITWKLVELAGETIVKPPLPGREPHLLLGPEGRMNASGGCNNMFGSYTLSADSLRLMPGGSTMMACPGGVMTQERKLAEILGQVNGYRITGETLELLGTDGVLARFSEGE